MTRQTDRPARIRISVSAVELRMIIDALDGHDRALITFRNWDGVETHKKLMPRLKRVAGKIKEGQDDDAA
jgi:hypothetical protein